MPFGKGSPRVTFEVNLEVGCLPSIFECNGDLELPWPVLCGMRNLPCVVAPQPILQIVGQADVVARRIGFANGKRRRNSRGYSLGL